MSNDWTWHGKAGHFIGASRCCFRLHTAVGEYRVSTIGCYHPGDSEQPHPVGADRLYETMVFRNGPDGSEPHDWIELDAHGYYDEHAAEAGHIAMCWKWNAR